MNDIKRKCTRLSVQKQRMGKKGREWKKMNQLKNGTAKTIAINHL